MTVEEYGSCVDITAEMDIRVNFLLMKTIGILNLGMTAHRIDVFSGCALSSCCIL
jgi:hypothetical protein